MTDHAKKPKDAKKAGLGGGGGGSALGVVRALPLFTSEFDQSASPGSSVPGTPVAAPAAVPPPLPPSPGRRADEPAAAVAGAVDVEDELEPYASTRCSPAPIESLANALAALGVLLVPVQQLRPTAPAPVPEANGDALNGSRRHHSLKPQSVAPSPPPQMGASGTKTAGSAVGARRFAAKERRKLNSHG